MGARSNGYEKTFITNETEWAGISGRRPLIAGRKHIRARTTGTEHCAVKGSRQYRFAAGNIKPARIGC